MAAILCATALGGCKRKDRCTPLVPQLVKHAMDELMGSVTRMRKVLVAIRREKKAAPTAPTPAASIAKMRTQYLLFQQAYWYLTNAAKMSPQVRLVSAAAKFDALAPMEQVQAGNLDKAGTLLKKLQRQVRVTRAQLKKPKY